ncbi:MAG TPA: hypothetical protein VFW16_04295 [Streptosporangiaceae bacterium]|nr:hypothetical protein [Streptosporangiaceae bacterium]
MRRMIALRWTAAATAAAAAVLAVAGCGQTQLGAAALYDNHRISSSTLADEVANLNAGFQADKGHLSIQYTQADMPRQVLTWMLRFATTERVAKRTGISVTPAQAQRQLNDEKARAGQAGDTLEQAAVVNGLPPDLLPELGRWIAIQIKLQDRFDHGVPPTTSAEQAALGAKINHVQCLAAKSMDIKVNPQYGAFDYRQFIVVPATSTLTVASGKKPSGQAPQLTPKC